MRPDALKQLLGQYPGVFLRVLGEEEGECQGAQPDERLGGGAEVEDLVVLVDLGLEGRMDGDEVEEVGVLEGGGGKAVVKD